ncbi:MAG: WbqC family protein [Duncaniella sp.]|uniref:WbqC family protein n=1 Tax=Duncaniella muricolitica TaxID=2880704 RepID=UPI0023C15FC7|nr:WbqC family protein [Duncaniella muricolitica]MDE5927112.1 WbqC family protein [Duncaniella sp.]
MRPILYPSVHLTLPPRLCGGIELYVRAWAAGSYAMDWDTAFDKRDKATHRFTIADTRGRLDLTVPIAKPASSRCRWSEIGVSTHGAWWDVHRVALESAYGRTPYFEFYIDRFLPMLTVGVTDRYPRLCDLASAWDEQIADILGLTRDNQREATEHDSRLKEAADLQLPPYRQVRASRLGFLPGLSVLDLIFNLGPESQIYLNDLANTLYNDL